MTEGLASALGAIKDLAGKALQDAILIQRSSRSETADPGVDTACCTGVPTTIYLMSATTFGTPLEPIELVYSETGPEGAGWYYYYPAGPREGDYHAVVCNDPDWQLSTWDDSESEYVEPSMGWEPGTVTAPDVIPFDETPYYDCDGFLFDHYEFGDTTNVYWLSAFACCDSDLPDTLTLNYWDVTAPIIVFQAPLVYEASGPDGPAWYYVVTSVYFYSFKCVDGTWVLSEKDLDDNWIPIAQWGGPYPEGFQCDPFETEITEADDPDHGWQVTLP